MFIEIIKTKKRCSTGGRLRDEEMWERCIFVHSWPPFCMKNLSCIWCWFMLGFSDWLAFLQPALLKCKALSSFSQMKMFHVKTYLEFYIGGFFSLRQIISIFPLHLQTQINKNSSYVHRWKLKTKWFKELLSIIIWLQALKYFMIGF